MKVGQFTNAETGQPFKSCVFLDRSSVASFVAFSSNLGELSPRQIADQKNDLQVVELETEGYDQHHFSLCKKGQEAWEDVDLGL